MNELALLTALLDSHRPSAQKAADIRRAVLNNSTVVPYRAAFEQTKAIFDHTFAVYHRFYGSQYGKDAKVG